MTFRPFVLALLCCVSTSAAAERTWMEMTLDGRKVGTMVVDRSLTAEGVVTSQVIDLRVNRGKSALAVHDVLDATEFADGRPRAFHAATKSSDSDDVVDAHARPDGKIFEVMTTVGGLSKVSLLQWPDGALLPEGQRLAFLAHGFARGTRYTVRTFDPAKQQVATLDTEVVGDETVDMPSGPEILHHLRQRLAGDAGDAVDLWVDDQGRRRRSIAPGVAGRMVIVACDEACATAPDQDVDVLRASMVRSPRRIPFNSRLSPLTYAVRIPPGKHAPFVDTDEQEVTDKGDGRYEVVVGNVHQAHEDPPTADDLAANPWVQSQAPEVIDLATREAGGARSDLARMRALRSFVSDYLERSDLDVGYASALETLRTRRGDCTEHAVLLTALARALHIPARIVTGLVYNERYAGVSAVFVPHAWTQAWIGDRWVSFDSAEGRFDDTHIAMGVGSGDPWRFFAAMDALGSIDLEQVSSPAGRIASLPPPTLREPPERPRPVESTNVRPSSPPSGHH